jgi:hypothetical protein
MLLDTPQKITGGGGLNLIALPPFDREHLENCNSGKYCYNFFFVKWGPYHDLNYTQTMQVTCGSLIFWYKNVSKQTKIGTGDLEF